MQETINAQKEAAVASLALEAERTAQKKQDKAKVSGDKSEYASSSSSRTRSKEDAHILEMERRAHLASEEVGSARPYEILGVDKHASPSAIRRAYRKLSLLFHPDKNPGHEEVAQRVYADIAAAYEVIGNPDKRS